MNMLKLTEEEKVFLYVVNKSLLSEKDVSEIENKINSNDSFKDLVENVRLVCRDINSFDSSKRDLADVTSRILSGSKGFHYFELKPVSSEDEAEELTLAAMQKQDADAEFVYYNTYASADNLVLVRLLRNSGDNTYRLFVLTENADNARYSVLQINKTGMEFVADEKGTVTFQSDHIHKNLDITVLLPIHVFSIDLNKTDRTCYSETRGKAAIEVERNKDTLIVEFENGYASGKKIYAVIDGDFNKYLKYDRIEGNTLAIDISQKKVSNIRIISVSTVK